eukprot:m.82226 g.82226  ORF g.82226 m.82226 type:complete len:609 (+) comp14608_c0_seq1:52-1878(+)
MLLACLFVLQVSVSAAQLCTTDVECSPNEFCPGCNTSSTTSCQRLPLLNEPCSFDSACLPSRCHGGMRCINNRCRLPPWPCQSQLDCRETQHCYMCDNTLTTGFCGELPTIGEPCGYGCYAGQCQATLICDEDSQTCLNLTGAPAPTPASSCLQLGCGSYVASAPCKCDTLCSLFNDCCGDAQICDGVTTPGPTTTNEVASTTTVDPLLSCIVRGCASFVPGASCNCDVFCSGQEDCCSDYVQFCEGGGPYPPPPPLPLPANVPIPPPPSASLNCQSNQVPQGQACVNYTWTSAPQNGVPVLPTLLAEISAVVINQQIIYFGDGELGTSDSTVTGVFDIQLGRFLNPSLYAKRPYPGDHSAVEAWNGKMYSFSGLCCQQFCTGCEAKQKVQIYDPTTNTWSLGTQVPWDVEGSQSSALINDKMYLCGGLGVDVAINTCGIYDPATDTWDTTTMPNMPKAVHHAASNTDGSRFYIFGGRTEGNPLTDGQTDVQIYDPVTNTWQWSGRGEVAAMPVGRTGMGSAAYLGGEFYIMGGEAFSDHPLVTDQGTFDLVEVYHPINNQWRQAVPMPAGLHGLYPVVHNEIMYIIGGGPQIDRYGSRLFFIYQPAV